MSYAFRVTFRAPLPFVFRWCTDYSPRDAHLEGEQYERRVLERGRGKVVFEDLSDSPTGWFWSRNVVTLLPPDRWHAEMNGNRRRWTADYRLRDLGAGRTELVFRGRRRPTALGPANPPSRQFQREVLAGWKHFARHLERDYRASHPRRRPARRSSR